MLVGVLVGADVTARAYAQSRLQQEVNRRSGSEAAVHAQIHSFPFLGRLLVQQKVSSVRFASSEVKSSALTFSNVSLSLHDVKVSRGKLLREQRVLITAIGRGSASGDVTAAALSEALHTAVEITNGKVVAKAFGQSVAADVEARDNGLVVRVAGLSLPVLTVPGTDLLPCLGGLQVGDGRIHFSCTVNRVPPAVLRLVNGVNGTST